MKKVILIMVIMSLVVFAGIAQATPKYVDVTPVRDGDTVIIPALPDGAKLLNVQIFDDLRGIPPRNLGAVNTFTIKEGEGFNFTYEDSTGRYWQMITPCTPSKNGLKPDCTSPKGCKYVRLD